VPASDRVAWSRLVQGEITPDRLEPARAARIAADITATLEAEDLNEPTRALLESLFLRGGVPVDDRVRRVAPAPAPAPAQGTAAPIQAGIVQAATTPAAPAAPAPQPAATSVATERTPSEKAVPAQEGQGQAEGQGQGQVRPVREEVGPVVGEAATLEQRSENEIRPRLKTGSLGALQVQRDAAPGVRTPLQELQQALDRARQERDRRVAEQTADPGMTPVAKNRVFEQADRTFRETVDRERIRWMSQLTTEQKARVKEALRDVRGLTPDVIARLAPAPAARPAEQRVGYGGTVVPASQARQPDPEPGPVDTRVRDALPAGRPAQPEPVRESAPLPPIVDPPPSRPAQTGRNAVQQEVSLPAAEKRGTAFGTDVDPDSPEYPAAIRERVIEQLKSKRAGIAGAHADALNVARKTTLEPYVAAAKRAAGGKRLTNIDVNSEAFTPIVDAMDAELQKHPAEAYPGPVKVRVGRGQFRDAVLFESPNAVSALVEEYTTLHRKYTALRKREQELDDTRAALAEANRTASRPDATKEQIARRDQLNDELRAKEKRAAKSRNNATRTKKSSAETQRLRDLSLALRASMAESVGKRIAAYITAKPGSERATVAKRFEDAIERGLVGMEQDLVQMIGGDALVDPAALRGALRPQYVARFTDAEGRPEYALVAPDDIRRGTFMPFNRHGEPITRYPGRELEQPALAEGEQSDRVIQGKSIGDVRAGLDTAGNVTPFISRNLHDVLEMASGTNLVPPVAELSRERLDWMMQNGFGVDVKDTSYKQGQAALKADPLDGHPGVQSAEDLVLRDGETAEDYLRRVLLTSTGSRYETRSGKKVPVYKIADTTAVHTALASTDNGRQLLKLLTDNRLIERRGGTYQTGDAPDLRIVWGRVPSGAIVAPNSTELLSEQQILERAAQMVDLTVFVGAREGANVTGPVKGAYSGATRAIVVGQADVRTFAHELGHDLTAQHLMHLADPAVIKDLVAATQAYGVIPHTASEGAAELTARWVEDPATVRATYPAAAGWLEAIFDRAGIRDRMDALSSLTRTNRAAPASAAIGAAQRSATQHKDSRRKRGTSNLGWGRYWVRAWSESMDKATMLSVVDKRLGTTDFMDLTYEAKLAQTGHTQEGVDSFLNGPVLDPATQTRGYGFNQLSADMKTMGLSDAQQAEAFQHVWGKSVLERDPLLRRKLFRQAGLNEDDYGPWATTVPPSVPNAPGFDSVAELRSHDELALQTWEQVAAARKAAGLSEPPKPVLYLSENVNPIPGTSGPAVDQNVSEEQARRAFEIVSRFKQDHEYNVVADLWRDLVRSFDDWRLSQGLITEVEHAKHRQVLYYVPQRTESTPGQKIEAGGVGGADIINPIQAMFSKIIDAHYWRAKEEPARALLRAGSRVLAERRDAANQAERFNQDVMLNEWFDPTDLAQLDEGLLNTLNDTRESGQASPLSDEFLLIHLDERTVDALLAADMIPPKLLKDPGKLIGQKYAFRVKDPDLRRALMADNDHAKALFGNHFVWQTLTFPATALRKLLTVFSPTFQAKNAVRDTFTAFMQSLGMNPARFVGTTWQGLTDAFSYANNLSTDKVKSNPEYSAYVASGVARSGLLSDAQNVEAILSHHELGRALSLMGDYKPRFGWLKRGLRPFEVAANTIDGMNRAGEFRRVVGLELRDRGVTDISKLHPREAEEVLRKAKRAAQEVTVNFARSGGQFDRALNELIPFFNPAKQGTLKTIQTLTAQRVYAGDTQAAANIRAAVAWGALAATALFQWYWLSDDPEDLEDYQEIPDAQRALYWHFPVGKYPSGKTQFMRVPKPQGPYAGVLFAFEKLFGQNPATWHDVAAETVSQSVPMTVVPTTLQLGLEVFTGSRLMAAPGRAGIPEWMKPIDAEAETTPRVSATSYMVSNALRGLGIDIGPLHAENLITGYTGGLGTLVVDAPKWWDRLSGQHKSAAFDAVSSAPVAKAFLAANPGFAARSITRAYDLLNEIEGKSKTADAFVRMARNNQINPQEAAQKILTSPGVAFGRGAERAATEFRKALSDARVMWNRINTDQSLSLVDRRIKLDQWVETMTEASRTFHDAVSRAQLIVEKNIRERAAKP
jgi:hypothetical protein